MHRSAEDLLRALRASQPVRRLSPDQIRKKRDKHADRVKMLETMLPWHIRRCLHDAIEAALAQYDPYTRRTSLVLQLVSARNQREQRLSPLLELADLRQLARFTRVRDAILSWDIDYQINQLRLCERALPCDD